MDGEQRGPILSKLLLHKLKEGELDGLTLVYCGNMTEWKKVAEVPSLKIEMAKIAADEESARLAFAKPSIEDQQKQVFVDDHSSNFVASTSCLFAENRQNVISGERKTFVADNGQLYMWDEQEDSWVEADKETTEMFNIEQSDDNISTNAGNKRKATDDHEDIVEDDVDGDDNKGNNSTGVSEETCNKKQQPKKKKKSKKKKGPNTWIYVTGLPPDISTLEIKDHFSKVLLHYFYRKYLCAYYNC